MPNNPLSNKTKADQSNRYKTERDSRSEVQRWLAHIGTPNAGLADVKRTTGRTQSARAPERDTVIEHFLPGIMRKLSLNMAMEV